MSGSNCGVGLFVDDFPIFHRGHELCLKYAEHQMKKIGGELIVLVSNSKNAQIPLPVRTNWIKNIYPDITVLESWVDLENEGRTTDKQRQVLEQLLNGKKITQLYSTLSNVEHLNEILGCGKNILIPSIRERMRGLAYNINQNAYANMASVNPIVYRDLVINVAFVGAQSTGKSTITEAMAKKYNTEFMFEYGRYHWDVYQEDNIETIPQIEEITERHLMTEDYKLERANKYLFTDTCPFVTLRYAMDWHGRASEKLLQYAKEAESRYDLIFLCGDDIPYADTPERDGAEQRTSFQSQIKYELDSRNVPYIYLTGTLEERIKQVEAVLARYRKYESLTSRLMKEVTQRKENSRILLR